MRDPAWLDDLDDLDDEDLNDSERGRSSRRMRPVLAILAAVPWLLVVALFVVPGRQGPPPSDDDTPPLASPDTADTELLAPDPATGGSDRDGVADDDDAHGDESAAAGHGPRPPDGTGAVSQLHVRAWPGPDTDHADLAPDLAATAMLAARSWLSGVDRHGDDAVPPSRDDTIYAEHLHLEGLEGEGDLLVARIVALLLDVDAANAPRLQRIAVPLAATPDGPRLVGTPWELPTPTLDLTPLTTEPVADPRLVDEAELALEQAGFGDPRLVGLARTAGWPLVATFSSDGRSDERQLWLRPADGRLVVAGQLAAPSDGGGTDGGGTDGGEQTGRGATDDADRIEDAGEGS